MNKIHQKTRWLKLFDALAILLGTYLGAIFIRGFYSWKGVEMEVRKS